MPHIFAGELAREQSGVKTIPAVEIPEVAQILQTYNLSGKGRNGTVEGFRKHPDWWVEFKMRIELGLEKPDASPALKWIGDWAPLARP